MQSALYRNINPPSLSRASKAICMYTRYVQYPGTPSAYRYYRYKADVDVCCYTYNYQYQTCCQTGKREAEYMLPDRVV